MEKILKITTLCVCFMLCLNIVCAAEKIGSLKLSEVVKQTQNDNFWSGWGGPIISYAGNAIIATIVALHFVEAAFTIGGLGSAALIGFSFGASTLTATSSLWALGGWTVGIAVIVIGIGTLIAGNIPNYIDQTIQYGCEPWDAPSEGNCELCNKGDVPCSQYRCDSLGHQCVFDTESKICILSLDSDTVPPVISFNSSKSNGYVCESTNQNGCTIKKDDKNTLQSGTSFIFGVTTNEYANCKYTFNNENGTYVSFEGFAMYPRDKSFYGLFVPPSIDSLNKEGLEINPEEETYIYVKCSDKNGNVGAPYEIKFKYDPLPDVTDPKYEYSSYITQNICVINQTMPIEIMVTDASTVRCRWSTSADSYASMTNDMQCPSIGIGKQLCSTNLTSISVEGTTYYFACNDSMGNYNQQSKNNNVTLRTGSELKIRSVTPTPGSAFYYPLTEMPINITVETMMGCNQGQATCYLKQKNQATNEFPTGDGAMFENTNNISGKSSQLLRLGNGTYTYLITCEDEAGHTTNTTTNFTVNIDTEAPVVARQYTDNNNQLHVITSYNTTCRYTTQEAQGCDFEFNEGLNMSQQGQREHLLNIPDKSKTYYIKCQDQRAVSTDCSATIKYDN